MSCMLEPFAEHPVTPQKQAFVRAVREMSEDLSTREVSLQMRARDDMIEVEASLTHPAADRHAETFFLPVNDLVREYRSERLLEDPFRLSVAQLELPGDAPREIDELDVEKWGARL